MLIKISMMTIMNEELSYEVKYVNKGSDSKRGDRKKC